MAGAIHSDQGLWLLQRSRNPRAAAGYNNRRILEAARRAGLLPRFIDMQETPAGAPAFLVPRSGTKFRNSDLDLIAALERTGSVSLNGAAALVGCRDKARMTQGLQRAGCAMPATRIADSLAALRAGADEIGFPCVAKPLRGSKGKGVSLCRIWSDLRRAFAEEQGRGLLLQTFIAEAAGRDIRVLVLDDDILGGIERCASGGDFRSNAAVGGTVRAVVLSWEMCRLSRAAARAFGLRFAGIDLMPSDAGPLVCEVNSAPGFEAFEAATGIDVAGSLIGALRTTQADDAVAA